MGIIIADWIVCQPVVAGAGYPHMNRKGAIKDLFTAYFRQAEGWMPRPAARMILMKQI